MPTLQLNQRNHCPLRLTGGLTKLKLMAFLPEMAADYEVIGILLGQKNSVRNVRAGAEGVLQKMIWILEEWTGTEDASWSAQIEASENHIPRLCGEAAKICFSFPLLKF